MKDLSVKNIHINALKEHGISAAQPEAEGEHPTTHANPMAPPKLVGVCS